jgi:hypothetical protein
MQELLFFALPIAQLVGILAVTLRDTLAIL